MNASSVLAMLYMALCMTATRTEDAHSLHNGPAKSASTFTKLPSALLEQLQRQGSAINGNTAQTLFIIVFAFFALILCGCFAGSVLMHMGDEEEDLKQPLMSPGKGHLQPRSSPFQQQQRSPGMPMVPSPQFGTLSPGIASISPQAPARLLGSPQAPAASGLLGSIWSSSRGMPPPLCTTNPPSSGQTKFNIAKSSFSTLSKRYPIEVTGAFDYPIAYAKLGTGAEGSRLELATEPSWRDVQVTVGPLDWPGILSSSASIHGPQRVLYGPFFRTPTGFAVGHISQPGSVVTLTPKRFANGTAIELCSASGQQLATVTDQGSQFQINMGPGVDGYLIITAVLATFIAEQSLIDELQATV